MRPLLLLLVGCTHHHHISDAHSLGGERVEIVGPAGTTEAQAIETPNGVVFQDPSGRLHTLGDVNRVEVERTGQGALEGLAWGGLAGAAVGVVTGLADGDDPPCEELCILNMSAEEKAVFGAILLGGTGALAGLIIGAVVGSTDVYEYPASTPVTVRAGGPRGSVAGVTVSF